MSGEIEPTLIKKEECLLILIDVQERLLPVISNKDEVLANSIKLAKFAGIVGLPMVVTEQEKLGPTVPELSSAFSDAQTFGKITFDSLADDGIREAIENSGKKTLILAGIEAHICVAQTALSALDLECRVHIVADAVGSRSNHNKKIALKRLRSEGAEITSTEMFLYEILRKAGTPEFKETLKLVK